MAHASSLSQFQGYAGGLIRPSVKCSEALHMCEALRGKGMQLCEC
jgi:hypothetical protein